MRDMAETGVNVRDFGARGDGAADDTEAVQAAVNACTEGGGGTVHLPAGTYRLTSAVWVNSGITLAGAGTAGTVLRQSSVTEDGIRGQDTEYVTVRDLTVAGPGTGRGNGIRLTRSAGPCVPYCAFERVRARQWGNCGFTGDTLIVSRFDGCVAEANGGDGFQLTSASGNTTSTAFTACYANANAGTGYELGQAVYCHLSGCAADGNSGGGYALYGCEAVVLAGCGAEANRGAAVLLSGGRGNAVTGLWVNVNAGCGVRLSGGESAATLTGCVERSAAGASHFILADPGTSVFAVNCAGITPSAFHGTAARPEAGE